MPFKQKIFSQSVRYFATPFITLDSNGNLDRAGERWDENYVVQLPSKPVSFEKSLNLSIWLKYAIVSS